MTNIIVVQFSESLQTSRDKRFNLTCLFRGPGEAVVTSGYIGAGWVALDNSKYFFSSVIKTHTHNSIKIVKQFKYSIHHTQKQIGKSDTNWIPSRREFNELQSSSNDSLPRPTDDNDRCRWSAHIPTGIARRLQSHQRHLCDKCRRARSIFRPESAADWSLWVRADYIATCSEFEFLNIYIKKSHSCPVDTFVFPELGRSRDGDSLEARFNAFKIPESNFLVFEATVKTCREGCQPAYCTGQAGRSDPSFGRRKRSTNGTETIEGDEKDLQVISSNGTSDDENRNGNFCV